MRCAHLDDEGEGALQLELVRLESDHLLEDRAPPVGAREHLLHQSCLRPVGDRLHGSAIIRDK